MTKLQKLLVAVLVSFLAGMIGCVAFQEAITPCYIHPDSIKFADANVPQIMPYTTLADAKYVSERMDYIQKIGRLNYDYLKENMATNLINAEQFKQTVFSPDGALGALLLAGTGLSIGGLVIRRPQDRRQIEELQKNGTKANS